MCKFCLNAKHAGAHVLEFWQILTDACDVCVAKNWNVRVCRYTGVPENLSKLTVCHFPVGNSN